MFARLISRRKAATRIFAVLALGWLAACTPVGLSGPSGGQAPQVRAGAPVKVALMVPTGTDDATNDFLARNLENAARMAISDLNGVTIDLRVYSSGATPDQAAIAATRAYNDGAMILLGPLFADSANAAGVVLANTGINVLAFSNNPTIAGGNVFILGPTFQNTAERLVQYARRNGINSYLAVHADDLQGNVGRDAVASAVRGAGGTLNGSQSYPLSQDGIFAAASGIAQAANSSGVDAIVMTAGANADLPILATALPERGLDPATTQYIGLTRWDVAPQGYALPGLQGGLFAMPDQNMTNIFESRYLTAFGESPHPLAGLAYDGIAAIGALVAQGDPNALSAASLTQPQGFQGTAGIFRLLPNGTNQRGLAVATIRNNQVVVLEAAPRSFGGAGF